MLAQEVERVFRARGWNSFGEAEIATGVPASTLQRLRKGARVKPQTAALFGQAVGENADKWSSIAVGIALPLPQPKGAEANDALLAYGEEIDARPYLYAMRSVQDTSAGIQRITDSDGPTHDLGRQWPVRAIKVRGGCMEPILKDGEVALILPPEAVYDGCIVTATVDIYHTVCKRIRIPNGGVPSYLEPINGEGIIPEERFIVSGVVADKISTLLPPRTEK